MALIVSYQGGNIFMSITVNLIVTISTLFLLCTFAMDTPTVLSDDHPDRADIREHQILCDPSNAPMIEKMWEQLRVHFRANKPEADEFWWQTAVDEPDRILERFLQGNQGNVDLAVDALIKSLKWRREYKVRDLVYGGEADNEVIPSACFQSGKGIFWGYDKDGYLMIYLYPRKNSKGGPFTVTQLTNHIVYQTELGRRLFQAGKDKVTVLIDLDGMSLMSFNDLSCAYFVASTLRNHYPEAINQIILVNINVAYWLLYSAVQPIVQFIVKKVRQVSKKEELVSIIGGKYLLSEFGGDCEYVYKYVPPNNGNNSKTSEFFDLLETANECASNFYVSGIPELKSKIRSIYRKLDRIIYPGDLYSRIGVVSKEDGRVNWDV